jgi:hypothetical protein
MAATPAGASIVNSFLAIPRPIGLPIVLEDGDDPRTDRQRCGGAAPAPIGLSIGMPISDDRPADPHHSSRSFQPPRFDEVGSSCRSSDRSPAGDRRLTCTDRQA